jgi:uncharacterized RDD family membrane protein YckC
MYCAKCGQSNDDQALFCKSCGTPLQRASQPLGYGEGTTTAGSPEYAGFWKRLLASLIDGILMFIPILPLYILILVDPRIIYFLIFYPLGLLLPWLYFAIMESSSRQATLGKMALGIVVTDTQGRQISFARATGRYFGKIISCLILYIGYLMIAFTQRKQGLHDIMAECLVVVKK